MTRIIPYKSDTASIVSQLATFRPLRCCTFI